MERKDELRIDIGNLSKALVNSNHYRESDMIIRRIYERCLEYFDKLTLESLETFDRMEVVDMEHKIRAEQEIRINFGGE